jgi:hypothetical protein
MKFKEVLTRLTGISCPVFGVSWNPPEAEIAVARRVLAYLEDRRVLYRSYDMEVPHHCVDSVIEMRKFLTDEIAKLDKSREIAQSLRGMRAACRKFLDHFPGSHKAAFHPRAFHGAWDAWPSDSLGELRGTFGIHIARLSAEYGLDIEDELASILPERDESERVSRTRRRNPCQRT